MSDAKTIKDAALKLGLSNRALARACGVSDQHLKEIVKGRRQIGPALERMLDALDAAQDAGGAS